MTHLVVCELEGPAALLAAAATLRQEGITSFDTHTPRPVPGLDEALGETASPLGGGTLWTASLFAALAGGALWSLGVRAWVPALPPMLVVMAFAAALGIGIAFVWHCRLPQRAHPLLRYPPYQQSPGGYWLSVVALSPEAAEKARGRLEALGAKNLTTFAAEGGKR